jgi:hypothetical protein
VGHSPKFFRISGLQYNSAQIFHHFPSFSIIFHHFPSFSIIFPRKYPDALEMRGKVEEMGGTTLLTVDATKLHKVMLGTTGGCRSCVGHPLERNVYEIE